MKFASLTIASVFASTWASAALAAVITCTPATVGPGDKLTIKLSQPLGDIAVITPKKLAGVNYFLLTEAGSSGLVQSNQLAAQRGVVIDVDTARLDTRNRLFFTPGVYEFVVGKNLESDDGSPVHKCRVSFAAKASAR